LWKGWKDAIAYRKYMMGQNVNTSSLLKSIDQNRLKECFGALRIHKEQIKYELMENQLVDETNPSIKKLNDQIEKEAVSALRRRK
jgi:Zn-finger protein